MPEMTISSKLLAAMRVQVPMPERGTILAPTRVSDGAGGGTVTYKAVANGTVDCRIDSMRPRRDSMQLVAAKVTMIEEYIGTFPFDAPLDSGQQVAVNGHTYQVVSLVSEHSWRVCQYAYLSRDV